MNIILLTEKDKIEEHKYCLNDKRSEHIKDVLKLDEFDKLEIGLLNGPKGNAVIEKIDQNKILLKINELYPQKQEEE